MSIQRRSLIVLPAVLAFCRWSNAQVQKPVRIVLGFPPGGGSDVVLRIIAQQLTQQLGQAVIVDNKPGADGVIAAGEVSRSSPDGLTLLFASGSSLVAAPLLRGLPSVPYDPFTDFAPIASLGRFTMVMLVSTELPVNTLNEFVAYTKARPGQLNYASSFPSARLAAFQLFKQFQLEMLHVPYKGDSPALTDLMAGRVHMMFSTAAASRGFVKDHRMRALLVLSDKASPVLPGVPTLLETGTAITVSPWAGLYGPAHIPSAFVERVDLALRTSMADPQVMEKLSQMGYEPVLSNAAEMATIHRSEYDVFKTAIRDGVKFD